MDGPGPKWTVVGHNGQSSAKVDGRGPKWTVVGKSEWSWAKMNGQNIKMYGQKDSNWVALMGERERPGPISEHLTEHFDFWFSILVIIHVVKPKYIYLTKYLYLTYCISAEFQHFVEARLGLYSEKRKNSEFSKKRGPLSRDRPLSPLMTVQFGHS